MCHSSEGKNDSNTIHRGFSTMQSILKHGENFGLHPTNHRKLLTYSSTDLIRNNLKLYALKVWYLLKG